MKVDYKKMILTTALFTLAVIFAVVIIIGLLMFFVFTKQSADFFYSLGSEKIAADLYHKVYEGNNDIYYCYKSLNIEIKLNDYDKVVLYYEELVSDDEYVDFIDKVTTSNEILPAGVLEKSAVLNEENYLANKYILSLVKIGENDKAFNFALEKFSNYDSFTFDNQGIYSFNNFINKDISSECLSKFTTKYDAFDDVLISEIQNYFNESYSLFSSKKTLSNNLEKAYLVALGNRLILVGQNINIIYDKVGSFDNEKATNLYRMLEINSVIKEII